MISDAFGAYTLLTRDLRDLFEFVHPTKDNERVFSHRSYALLLRASTEFENLCRVGSVRNDLSVPRSPNIGDYSDLLAALHISKLTVVLNQWSPEPLELRPLEGWNLHPHELSWYRSYNKVKHDRAGNFQHANLLNVVTAISACFAMLIGLREVKMELENHNHPDDNSLLFRFHDPLFSIRIPSSVFGQHFSPT